MSTKVLKHVVVCGVIAGMLASAMSCSKKKSGGADLGQAAGGSVSSTQTLSADGKSTVAGAMPSKAWDGKGVAPKDASVTFQGGAVGAAVNGGDLKASGAAAAGTPASTEPEGPTCFTQTYTHKKMMSHGSEEACSHHKNVFKLAHAKVNPKSICVRVNGTPVRFTQNKKNTAELMIGAVAGPDAKITARYCLGKNTCNEDCTIPRDSFMDAIGGAEDMAGTQIGHWSAETDEVEAKRTAKLNADLKKELAELDESAPGTSEGMSIFKDWVGEAETPACGGTKQAKATDPRS